MFPFELGFLDETVSKRELRKRNIYTGCVLLSRSVTTT